MSNDGEQPNDAAHLSDACEHLRDAEEQVYAALEALGRIDGDPPRVARVGRVYRQVSGERQALRAAALHAADPRDDPGDAEGEP